MVDQAEPKSSQIPEQLQNPEAKRDEQRREDMVRIRQALEKYKSGVGRYPPGIDKSLAAYNDSLTGPGLKDPLYQTYYFYKSDDYTAPEYQATSEPDYLLCHISEERATFYCYDDEGMKTGAASWEVYEKWIILDLFNLLGSLDLYYSMFQHYPENIEEELRKTNYYNYLDHYFFDYALIGKESFKVCTAFYEPMCFDQDSLQKINGERFVNGSNQADFSLRDQ